MNRPVTRCTWSGSDPLMIAYHDREWGVPLWDSRALWEMLVLEGFQAGLSWSTVLKRREAFRLAFEGFEPATIADYGQAAIERLLEDPGIIRSRAKIEATIGNARAYLDLGHEFSEYVWSFVDGTQLRGDGIHVQAETDLSREISKDLKSKGFKFVGPVIVYAWMQAVGLVNDHSADCFRRVEV